MVSNSTICIIGGYDGLSKSLFKILRNKYKSTIFINLLSTTFHDENLYSSIIIEGYFSSFEKTAMEYSHKYNKNNRPYLEAFFLFLSKTQLISFGYFFDHKNRKGFSSEKKITTFPKFYKENVLYIL